MPAHSVPLVSFVPSWFLFSNKINHQDTKDTKNTKKRRERAGQKEKSHAEP